MRTIFHVDMDAFFVSVEELFDPSLKGKPVVVGGRPDQRGVVSAASYEARKFGVHSALPLRTAYKLCPQAIFLDGHPHLYREYSDKVCQVFKSFTPQVEMASIDEAYLDMTGTERLHGPPLRGRSRAPRGGEARNRAELLDRHRRLAADRQSGLRPGQAERRPLGTAGLRGTLAGAARRAQDPRRRQGDREEPASTWASARSATWRKLDEAFLEKHFGQWGLALAGKARGEDAGGWFDGVIGDEEEPKSISHEHTFDTGHRGPRAPSKPPWRGFPKWWDAAFASTACTPARSS